MKIKPTTLEKYARFFALGKGEPKRLERWPIGETPAVEAFHIFESSGKRTPCGAGIDAYLTGKEIHGMTVKMVAEDYNKFIIFRNEIIDNYPKWVSDEIFALAVKLKNKCVPTAP